MDPGARRACRAPLRSGLFREPARHAKPRFLQRLLVGNIIDACSLLRRTTWEECGGYDTGMPNPRGYKDWELWLQAAKRGWEFVHIAEVMFDYLVRSDSLVRACQLPENHSRLVHYLVAKHRDLYAPISPRSWPPRSWSWDGREPRSPA